MDPAQWVGRDIDGRYRVLSMLGFGGMGTVLRAKHLFTGELVALKILHPQFQLDSDIRQRFLAEAQAPNTIGHPAIVRVLDAGRTPEGTMYIAMELLVGRTLRAAVHRRDLSFDQIKRVLLDLLAALGQAHARNFVHRDLKPDNVFLCAPNDDVKLLDFGIVKVLDDVVTGGLTGTGVLLGTPTYMAPEQLADARYVDARADLWAIGVMVYELITGRLPIPGTVPEQLAALAKGQVIPIRHVLPGVTLELEQFFARALAIDPRHRFGSSTEMMQAIAALPSITSVPQTVYPTQTHVGSTVATAAPVRPRPAPPTSKSKAIYIVAFVALFALVVGITIALTRGSSTPEPPPPSVAVVADAPSVVVAPDSAPAEEPNDDESCAARCAWLDRECGTRFPTCESDCATKPATFIACYERSRISCSDGAMCGFQAICRKAPAGKQTCTQAAMCESRCKTEACLCTCAAQLAPRHALPFAQFNACWARALTAGCNDAICLKNLCAAPASACERAN